MRQKLDSVLIFSHKHTTQSDPMSAGWGFLSFSHSLFYLSMFTTKTEPRIYTTALG